MNESTVNSHLTTESNASTKTCTKRPPLPNRCASAERASITSLPPSGHTQHQPKHQTKQKIDYPQKQQNCVSSSPSQRCSSLDRSSSSIKSENTIKADTGKRVLHVSYAASNNSKNFNSPNHYAVPKRTTSQSHHPSVPNFHEEKRDMGMLNILIILTSKMGISWSLFNQNFLIHLVIPQPVYMNSQQLFPQASNPDSEKANTENSSQEQIPISQQDSMVSNCTITSNENTSVIRLQSTAKNENLFLPNNSAGKMISMPNCYAKLL